MPEESVCRMSITASVSSCFMNRTIGCSRPNPGQAEPFPHILQWRPVKLTLQWGLRSWTRWQRHADIADGAGGQREQIHGKSKPWRCPTYLWPECILSFPRLHEPSPKLPCWPKTAGVGFLGLGMPRGWPWLFSRETFLPDSSPWEAPKGTIAWPLTGPPSEWISLGYKKKWVELNSSE